MAIYKIFPIKDTFLSSQYPTSNYGRDEILDISTDSLSTNRALVYFDNNEINQLIETITGSYTSYLSLYLANSSNIPQEYNIEIHSVSSSWIMGTGRSGDEPNPKNGASWNYSNPNTTSSLWLGGNYINYNITQSFNYQDSKDINCDVTPIVNDWNTSTVYNNGFLIKHTDVNESSSNLISTQFFSTDTHTIYPPSLDFYWNDVSYSSSINVINNENFITTLYNNKNEFQEDSIYTFRLKNRDLYPARQFQTSSLYLNNKILPSSSYWALKDVKTEEIVFNYNDIGTKIGADNNSNYFTVYMGGLQPERYYQILIKTIINNNTIIIDNPSNYFKIVR